jgi:hypothetical protein
MQNHIYIYIYIFSSSSRFRNSFGFQCFLILLDGFEELREVALPKSSASAFLVFLPILVLEHASYSLNYLYEQGWPVKYQITPSNSSN